MNMTLVPEIAAEAKALVALAFRNGPIEDLHAGKLCPTCGDRPEFSHISDDEIRTVMYDPEKYQRNVAFGQRYTKNWDDPELKDPVPEGIHPK